MTQAMTYRRKKWWPVLLILTILVAIILMLLQRWNISGFDAHPNPAKNYDESLQRIQAMQNAETNLNPLCKTKLMTHGKETDRVIVFAHGYSTCPQQFAELGKRFYELGYNVLIVPAPRHGFADRMTQEQGKLKAEELATYANTIVDIGQGLGRHVTIAGMSMGGIVAAWSGQNRSDVDLAVVISPGFSFQGIPIWAVTPVENIFTLLPPTYEWWNPSLKEKGGPDYAYPVYSKHTLGEIIRFGFAVDAQAAKTAPLARTILVITNGGDKAVDNTVTAQVIKHWQAHQGNIVTYEFPKELNIGHDLIDPNDTSGDITIVYPKLIALITQQEK